MNPSLKGIECDTVSFARTCDSCEAPNTLVEDCEEQALGDRYASCEISNQSTNSNKPLEKQQYL